MNRAAKRTSAAPYRPPIDVRPWRDPVSGQTYYSIMGPMQSTDPRMRLLTHGEAVELLERMAGSLGVSVGGDAA